MAEVTTETGSAVRPVRVVLSIDSQPQLESLVDLLAGLHLVTDIPVLLPSVHTDEDGRMRRSGVFVRPTVVRLSYASPLDVVLAAGAGSLLYAVLLMLRDWGTARRGAAAAAREAEAHASMYERYTKLIEEYIERLSAALADVPPDELGRC